MSTQTTLRLVDAHCHLSDEDFSADLEAVIERARRAGVVAMITSSLNKADALRALEIARSHPGVVFLSIGFDPTIEDEAELEAVMELARELAGRGEVVAIGEVGLDFYWVRSEGAREAQKERFRMWIRLAEELGLPLVVHSRSAGKYAIGILLEEGYGRVLMHAFDGRVGWALKGAREGGFYFSIPTSVVRSQQKRKLAKAVPLENLMVETDAPVLGPEPRARNEPANLPLAVRAVAELKGLAAEEVAEATFQNALEFFGLRGRLACP